MKRRNFIKSLVVGTYIACGFKLIKNPKFQEPEYYVCKIESWTEDGKVERSWKKVKKDQAIEIHGRGIFIQSEPERGNYPKSMGITGKEEVIFWEPACLVNHNEVIRETAK